MCNAYHDTNHKKCIKNNCRDPFLLALILTLIKTWISNYKHNFIMGCNYSSMLWQFNSLAPGRFQKNLRILIFKLILMIGGWDIFCKIALRWMSMDLTDDKAMAWCRQATSHYLSQCWPRSSLPYGVTRPQWVNYNTVQVRAWMSDYIPIFYRGLLYMVFLSQKWHRKQWINRLSINQSIITIPHYSHRLPSSVPVLGSV